MSQEQACQRCGETVTKLYDFEYTDDDGETVKEKICWNCDWEISNGWGDFTDDAGDIVLARAEEDYAYDPINNPGPY